MPMFQTLSSAHKTLHLRQVADAKGQVRETLIKNLLEHDDPLFWSHPHSHLHCSDIISQLNWLMRSPQWSLITLYTRRQSEGRGALVVFLWFEIFGVINCGDREMHPHHLGGISSLPKARKSTSVADHFFWRHMRKHLCLFRKILEFPFLKTESHFHPTR